VKASGLAGFRRKIRTPGSSHPLGATLWGLSRPIPGDDDGNHAKEFDHLTASLDALTCLSCLGGTEAAGNKAVHQRSAGRRKS